MQDPVGLHREPLEQRIRPKTILLHHAFEVHALGRHIFNPAHRLAVRVVRPQADQPLEMDLAGAHR